MIRHIVFDLDGTLVDSLPGIAQGVNRALHAMQRRELSQQLVRGMIGQGARNLCAQALGYKDVEYAPPDELEQMYRLFCREYPLCWQAQGTRPYLGVSDMLRRLAAVGVRLAVLSNKPHEVTLPMVQELFADIPFDPIMGYTGRYPRKPAPDALLAIAQQWGVAPQQLTLVGDSLYDAHTARAAGAGLVLVAWGYARTADLQTADAPLAHTVAQLSELLTAP